MSAKITRILPDTTDLRQAVQETVGALPTTPAHTAAARLALEYADAIDTAAERGEALEKLGPKLLAALEALGATAGKSTTKPTTQPTSELERLRAARSRRTN